MESRELYLKEKYSEVFKKYISTEALTKYQLDDIKSLKEAYKKGEIEYSEYKRKLEENVTEASKNITELKNTRKKLETKLKKENSISNSQVSEDIGKSSVVIILIMTFFLFFSVQYLLSAILNKNTVMILIYSLPVIVFLQQIISNIIKLIKFSYLHKNSKPIETYSLSKKEESEITEVLDILNVNYVINNLNSELSKIKNTN